MDAKLIVISGRSVGREIPLPSSQFIIGRSPACHLRPHSMLVSKLHCAIGRQAGHVIVRDLNSRNKTYINDEPISNVVRVQDGDILAVGPLQFKLALSESTGGPSFVQKEQLHWLMNNDVDNSELVAHETVTAPVPPHRSVENQDQEFGVDLNSQESAESCSSGHTANEAELSAGQFLHDYFQQRFGQ